MIIKILFINQVDVFVTMILFYFICYELSSINWACNIIRPHFGGVAFACAASQY